jgi:hypothetical protein
MGPACAQILALHSLAESLPKLGSSGLARQPWLVLARQAGSSGLAWQSGKLPVLPGPADKPCQGHARAMPGPCQGPCKGPCKGLSLALPCHAWAQAIFAHGPWPATPLAILACHPWAWQGKGSGSLGLASPAGPASIPPSLPRPCPSLSASLAHLPPLSSTSRARRSGPSLSRARTGPVPVQATRIAWRRGLTGKVHSAGEISHAKYSVPFIAYWYAIFGSGDSVLVRYIRLRRDVLGHLA